MLFYSGLFDFRRQTVTDSFLATGTEYADFQCTGNFALGPDHTGHSLGLQTESGSLREVPFNLGASSLG